jgi:three-Cys-motif partner protein
MLNDTLSTQRLTNEVDCVLPMPPIADEHPEYWQEYTNLQHVKHALLHRYLGGWFPILARWRGRVVYIDCHAGRGLHASGQKGSPLVALDTLITHRHLPNILQNAEVCFLFIEGDAANKQELETHLANNPLPAKIRVDVVCEDFERVIQGIIDHLTSNNQRMAPAFVFVDPYGFKLSMDLLTQLKAFERCELFVNFMWRYVDMAIANPAQEANMDRLFGCREWRELRAITDPTERCEAAIQLLQKGLGARYVTWIKMLGDNRAIKYVLIHVTNHPRGRELMKDAIWSVSPEGDFAARVGDNPQQEILIQPDPNLEPLIEWLWRKYRGHAVRYQEIKDALTDTMFLPKHLNTVIRKLRDTDQVRCLEYDGRFAFEKNPLIDFNPSPTAKSRGEK